MLERSGEAGPDIKNLEASKRWTGAGVADVEDRMKGGGLLARLYHRSILWA